MPRSTEILDFLHRNRPYSELPEIDLHWLAERLSLSQFAAGEVLLHPGESPTDLIFILEGMVRVEAAGKSIPVERQLIAEIAADECFPLEALHEVRAVFSTYRASQPLRILKLAANDFTELKARSPLFQQYCDDRAGAFLVSTKRLYEAHFARRADGMAMLDAPLQTLRLRMPDVCSPETSLIAAAGILAASGELAIVVVDAQMHPLGVFTLHDLINRVLLVGGDISQPVSDFMTIGLVTLPLEANGYEAAQAMADHGLRQILVVDHGQIKGVISERDLFAAQQLTLGQLSARIRWADSIEALAPLAQENWNQARGLMKQGVAAEPLTRIISSLNDRLADRVLEICAAEETEPLPQFCWIALGSEGRQEQTLSTDQDNGIIFADGPDNETARQRLLAFAQRANQALAQCGVPLCKGGIMASNPKWCLSVSEWKSLFASWIEQPGPEAILNSTIFFDFRPSYGDQLLALSLKTWLINKLNDQNRFFANLAAEALKRSPPLGMIRDFVVDQKTEHPGTIDLKLNGVTLFVDAARVLGLRTGCEESGTGERLRHAAKALRENQATADSWVEGFHFVQMLRLRHQHALIEAGEKPHNRIDPYKLNEMDRKVLIESLKQAKSIQKRLESLTTQ